MKDRWEVIDSIRSVARDEWDAVVRGCGGSVFQSHRWLMSYEEAPPAPLFHTRHLLLRKGGQLRAVAPMYHVAEDPHYTGYGPDYGFDHPILRTPMLVGHSWYSYFNGVLSLEPADQIADSLVATMHDVAGEIDAPFYGFPGVPEQDPLGPELALRGFTPIYTEATSGVDFAGSAQAHLDTLRTAKLRREFRRLAGKAEKLGAEVRQGVEEGSIEAFAKLVEDVCARHGIPSINPPHSLRSIFRNLDGNVHFLSVWRDERLLGGFVLLQFDDVLYAWIAGLDYEHNKEFGTYHALYAQTLALAERLAVRRIEMGRSMYGFKTRMGFHPQLLVSWFRARNDQGAELLLTGVPELEAACRTRWRIAEAYRSNGLDVPESLLGDARFAPVPVA
ncbi:MAG TPA: GNAT family N-acetyltransferase [Acidimicrobiales bacterium]|nr:GNAT family N-acetyltransferase [Acidimicrobiales bacterium]